MTETPIETLAARIRAARRVTILTGAGVSAASGVPTFRGTEGLWRSFRPEELATPEAFERNPSLVWEWYAWRRETIAACRPSAAHEVIARWSRRLAGSPAASAHQKGGCDRDGPPHAARHVGVITQNVDDLHVRAGTAGLVRLHGSIWELHCHRGCGAAWREERVPMPEVPPRCPSCGELARPAVVWFGEALAAADVDAALRACRCDVFLAIGTSAVVYPAAGLVDEARRRGAYTAEINAEPTPASSRVDVAIQGPAEEVLPHLDRLV